MGTIDHIMSSAQEYAASVNVRLLMGRLPYGINGDLEITDLYADTPGQGDGTKALQNLCDLADEHCVSLYLHPECERNKAFYARFGFERRPRPKYTGLQLERHPRSAK